MSSPSVGVPGSGLGIVPRGGHFVLGDHREVWISLMCDPPNFVLEGNHDDQRHYGTPGPLNASQPCGNRMA